MSGAALPLTTEVFTILSALIEERVGLHYGIADRELVEHKISARALEAGFDSLLDYYYYLRYDAGSEGEFEALVENLVVNETYFFREYEQLATLVDCVLKPLVDAGRRPRIWSAACASGEEPLTLGMILEHRGLLDSCSIIASDVSRRALDRAKQGKFGLRAFRQLPPDAVAERWLVREQGSVRLRPGLFEHIDWRRINLTDSGQVKSVGPCDAIVCRNVLIYFRTETTQRVVASLVDLLPAEGVLLVGVSESLLRFGIQLSCEERRNVFLYRKQGAAE